jgi:MFS family permease
MKNPYLLSLPIALATITVMLATDLYLPAVPTLHRALGGTAADGQYTLASFIAAFAVGQLVIGALGDRYDKRKILVASMMAFAAASLACAVAPSMGGFIALRALQGFVGAAGVALAPAMIRELGDEMTTIRLVGFHSSIQALVPAAAPAIGLWLVAAYGWTSAFFVVSAAAMVAAAVFLALPRRPAPHRQTPLDHPVLVYAKLLANRRFMAFTLGHGLGVGALMTFIFAAPYLLTTLYGRDMSAFVWMQVFLISAFMIAVNAASMVAKRIGIEAAIMAGASVQLAGGLGFLGLALMHAAPSTAALTVALIPVNVGLGLRAGATFTRAMDSAAAPGGSTGALMIFLISLVMSAGTALVAPVLHFGAWTVALAVVAQLVASLALLALGNACPARLPAPTQTQTQTQTQTA